MPEPRHFSWVSKIEKGTQEPTLADQIALADILNVDVRFLLTGEASGLTEFAARMQEFEAKLHPRYVRLLLRHAQDYLEETEREASGD